MDDDIRRESRPVKIEEKMKIRIAGEMQREMEEKIIDLMHTSSAFCTDPLTGRIVGTSFGFRAEMDRAEMDRDEFGRPIKDVEVEVVKEESRRLLPPPGQSPKG